MKIKRQRMYVHPDFKKLICINAKLMDRNVIEFTKDISDKNQDIIKPWTEIKKNKRERKFVLQDFKI